MDAIEERISELENMIRETSKTENRKQKSVAEYLRTVTSVTYSRKRREKGTEARITEKFPSNNVRHQTTDPGSSENRQTNPEN